MESANRATLHAIHRTNLHTTKKQTVYLRRPSNTKSHKLETYVKPKIIMTENDLWRSNNIEAELK